MSCAGNGYLSSNELIPFPFEDGQSVGYPYEKRPDIDLAVQKCFVDAGINVSRVALHDEDWPSISHLSVSIGSISFKMSCLGHDSTISVSASGKSFPVVRGSEPWGSYVIVMSSEGISELSGLVFGGDDSSSSSSVIGETSIEIECSLRMCARCVTLVPASLSSIMVYDGVNDRRSGPHFVLEGDISIKPGNNMLLSDPERQENGIELVAAPGEGLGIIRCGCTGNNKERSVLISPDGHARIFNGTCYDLEPCDTFTRYVDGEPRRARTLRIHAKCTACCTCEMYESIVNDRLAKLASSIRASKARLDELVPKYNSAVSRFNNRIWGLRLNDVTMSLSGMPIGANLGSKLVGTKVRGKMGRCSFTAVIRNSSFKNVVAAIKSMSGTDRIVEASVIWSSKNGQPRSKISNSISGISGKKYTIYPGRSMVVTFVSVKDEMVESVESGGYSGSISVGISGPYGSIGTLSRSIKV